MISCLIENDGVRLLFEDDLCKKDVVCDDTMVCSTTEEYWAVTD